MKVLHARLGKRKAVNFTAENSNDPDWKQIIRIMQKNKITVLFGNENKMSFEWSEE